MAAMQLPITLYIPFNKHRRLVNKKTTQSNGNAEFAYLMGCELGSPAPMPHMFPTALCPRTEDLN